MAQYLCCYCGKNTATPSGGFCSYSPHKSHEFISADEKKDFICSYCGKKTNNPSGGPCPYGPNGMHKFIVG